MAEHRALHREIVERLRAAIAARDFAQLRPVLAEDVRFGSCRGVPQVVRHLQHLGHATDIVHIDVLDDLVVAMLDFPPGQAGDERVAVLFVRDGRVEELQFAPDREQALCAMPTPPPLPGPGGRVG